MMHSDTKVYLQEQQRLLKSILIVLEQILAHLADSRTDLNGTTRHSKRSNPRRAGN